MVREAVSPIEHSPVELGPCPALRGSRDARTPDADLQPPKVEDWELVSSDQHAMPTAAVSQAAVSSSALPSSSSDAGVLAVQGASSGLGPSGSSAMSSVAPVAVVRASAAGSISLQRTSPATPTSPVTP